jgi:hypothetical protein
VRHFTRPKQAQGFLVRLACVKHAASVHSEPGSNSPLNPIYIFDLYCVFKTQYLFPARFSYHYLVFKDQGSILFAPLCCLPTFSAEQQFPNLFFFVSLSIKKFVFLIFFERQLFHRLSRNPFAMNFRFLHSHNFPVNTKNELFKSLFFHKWRLFSALLLLDAKSVY